MWQRQSGNCPACHGSGIGQFIFHGYEKDGSECLEPVRCETCGGFGSVDAEAPQPSANGSDSHAPSSAAHGIAK